MNIISNIKIQIYDYEIFSQFSRKLRKIAKFDSFLSKL